MFSPVGTYPAVGLFSLPHIIFAVICIILVCVFVFLTRKMTKEQFHKRVKIYAAIVTCLEAFKISWNWAVGEMKFLNAWVPLYFCSLFIYSLWLASCNNKKLNQLGYSYMAMAGIICGLVFIISPSTSFNNFPIFHFQCIYSMFFHSLMVYCGFMVLVTKSVKINMKLVYSYWVFILPFIIVATIINETTLSNLMFFRSPGGVPLKFLFTIDSFSHPLYTLVMVLAHMSLGIIVLLSYKLFIYVHSKKVATELTLEDQEDQEKFV